MQKLVFIFDAGLNVFLGLMQAMCSYLLAGDLTRSDNESWEWWGIRESCSGDTGVGISFR